MIKTPLQSKVIIVLLTILTALLVFKILNKEYTKKYLIEENNNIVKRILINKDNVRCIGFNDIKW